MTAYDRIVELCAERHMSKRQLSIACDFHPSTIAKWREHAPSTENLQKVADFFGVSIDYLIGNSDVRKIEQRTYYTDGKTAEKAAELHHKQRILLDASFDLAPSQLDLLINMANQMKGTNRDG